VNGVAASSEGSELDQVVRQLESSQPTDKDNNSKPNIVALATSVGLILFLVADALPGGLSGVAGFVIGFGSVIGIWLILVVASLAIDNHERRLRLAELELEREHEMALLALLVATKGLEREESDAFIAEILRLAQEMLSRRRRLDAQPFSDADNQKLLDALKSVRGDRSA
jgi:hypothetical protein